MLCSKWALIQTLCVSIVVRGTKSCKRNKKYPGQSHLSDVFLDKTSGGPPALLVQKPSQDSFLLLHYHQMWIKPRATGDHTNTFTLSSYFNADAEIDIIGHQVSTATEPVIT